MTLEVIVSYSRGNAFVYKKDVERSVPEKPISETEAQQFMKLLEMRGLKRHETATQIFYDLREDATHVTEYLFRK